MQKYTNDKGTQIVLYLLKAHGIRKVIASPGTTNIALIASMQYDPWFEIYSSVDERSAAYMACGMAAESGEAVVITCTGATASRNYLPGLTEAYYRKLPILAITGSHGDELNGHLHAQVIDRSNIQTDAIRMSVGVDQIDSSKDEWATIVNVNKALLELWHHGGGPVHINLRVGLRSGFTTELLPEVRVIRRYMPTDCLVKIPVGRVAIFVGSHKPFTKEETEYIDLFCANHNGVVFCDHTSGYNGRYKILNALCFCQHHYCLDLSCPDLLIHIGEVSGEMYGTNRLCASQTWRVSEDGEVKDLFHNLTSVFEMSDQTFFKYYMNTKGDGHSEYYEVCKSMYKNLLTQIPELPFGNIWMAQQMHDKLPEDSAFFVSIFNSLRSWNFFNVSSRITTSCNVGGFGIDGPISTLLGSSLVNPDKLHFIVVGDLAFFYDLNSLGNRHMSSNIRIMLVNNGCGTEFRNYDHPATMWGDKANLYMAAGGHFGQQSQKLVKHYAEDLGFEYMTASTKEEFMAIYEQFLSPKKLDKPIVFEVFTSSEDESQAIKQIRHIIKVPKPAITEKIMNKTKGLVKAIFKYKNT